MYSRRSELLNARHSRRMAGSRQDFPLLLVDVLQKTQLPNSRTMAMPSNAYHFRIDGRECDVTSFSKRGSLVIELSLLLICPKCIISHRAHAMRIEKLTVVRMIVARGEGKEASSSRLTASVQRTFKNLECATINFCAACPRHNRFFRQSTCWH